jgi:hypothetical protein
MNDLQTNQTAPKSLSNPAYRSHLSIAFSALAIVSGLAIAGCKSSTATPPTDAALTQAVQSKIAADSSLASEPIQAAAQQGVVTLTGTTSNDAARSLAANDAAQVAGVKTVVNDLVVQPPQPNTAAAAPAPAPAPAPRPAHRNDRPEKQHKPSAEIQQQPVAPAAPLQAAIAPPAPVERTAPVQPPAPPAVPEVRSVTLPADTTIPIRMNQTLDSATTQQGDTFAGTLASDILVDGRVVLRQGTAVSGRVTAVQEAAHFKGNSLLSIELTSIEPRSGRLPITTETFSKEGNGRGKNSAEKIGGGAAVGAILGGIFGGGKGAAIGAAAGGGAGAGAQAITRGQQVQIPAESLVRFHLANPITVRVSGDQSSGQNRDRANDLQRHD